VGIPKAIIVFFYTYLLAKPFGWIFKRKTQKINYTSSSYKTKIWSILKTIIIFIYNTIIALLKFIFIDNAPQQTMSKPEKNTTTNKANNAIKSKTFVPKGKPIAYGGEAEIYKKGFGTLAKVYFPKRATQLKYDVITKLINMNLPKNIITPTAILNNKQGDFIGYEMPKAKGIPLEELFFQGGLQKYFPKYNLLDILELCLTIVYSYKELHKYSIIAGDISHGNILIVDKSKINIIDTDSFQINKPNGVGQFLYTRPNNFHKSEDSYMKNTADDAFAVTVLVFRLLLGGYTPYHEDNNYKITNAFYPFDPQNQHAGNQYIPDDIIKSYHNYQIN